VYKYSEKTIDYARLKKSVYEQWSDPTTKPSQQYYNTKVKHRLTYVFAKYQHKNMIRKIWR